MTRTEGAFCVSVGGMMAERDHNYSGWSRVRFFVPVKLKSVLAKYGELKTFRLLKEDEERCNQVRFILRYILYHYMRTAHGFRYHSLSTAVGAICSHRDFFI